MIYVYSIYIIFVVAHCFCSPNITLFFVLLLIFR